MAERSAEHECGGDHHPRSHPTGSTLERTRDSQTPPLPLEMATGGQRPNELGVPWPSSRAGRARFPELGQAGPSPELAEEAAVHPPAAEEALVVLELPARNA